MIFMHLTICETRHKPNKKKRGKKPLNKSLNLQNVWGSANDKSRDMKHTRACHVGLLIYKGEKLS